MATPTPAATDAAGAATPPDKAVRHGLLTRISTRTGMSPRTVIAGSLLPLVALVVIVGTIGVAPADQRSVIFFASLIGLAAGLSSTAIGVYGGVLVPGLLLLSIDARFAAALSLFLQVLVIPLAAGSHYRMGNFSKKVALPLVIGGVIGAFIGPFFAAGELLEEPLALLLDALALADLASVEADADRRWVDARFQPVTVGDGAKLADGGDFYFSRNRLGFTDFVSDFIGDH